MTASRPRILIVGAGIAGLATARALIRSGFSPEMIEREPAVPDGGTGIYLPGNAARALRALGLDADVAARAAEIPRQRFLDHRGRLLADIDVGEYWAGAGPCRALHRAALRDALLDGVDGIPMRMGVTADRIGERGSTVEVAFSDGGQGAYDLVVGADGVHSGVRPLAVEDAPARSLGQFAWRLVAPCPPRLTTWSVMLGHGATLLMVPIGDGRAYCYCEVDAESPAELSRSRLTELLSRFAEPAQAVVDGAGEVHVSAIEEVELGRWSRGRTVLLGDAAHATSPNMAQGAAMALEDAVVLAECLGERESMPSALAAFESRRRARTDWVRAQTHRRDRARRLPAAARNLVLRTAWPRMFRANYAPLLAAA